MARQKREYFVQVLDLIVDERYGNMSGDAHTVKSFSTKAPALALAKKLSLLTEYNGRKINETYVYMDIEYPYSHSVWFFKNGVLTHQDEG